MHRIVHPTSFVGAHLNRLLQDKSGTTAIEYTLIAAGISIVIIVAVNSIGTEVKALFDRIVF